MEREFDLRYYGGFSIDDLRRIGARKIAWFHGRLRDELEKSSNKDQ